MVKFYYSRCKHDRQLLRTHRSSPHMQDMYRMLRSLVYLLLGTTVRPEMLVEPVCLPSAISDCEPVHLFACITSTDLGHSRRRSVAERRVQSDIGTHVSLQVLIANMNVLLILLLERIWNGMARASASLLSEMAGISESNDTRHVFNTPNDLISPTDLVMRS